MNDALLELVYDDPLNAWEDIPVLELSGPLDGRVDAVLAALDQIQRPRPGGPGINRLPPDLAGLNSRDATPHRSDSVERFTTGFLDAPKTSFEPLAPISQPRVVFPGNVIARP
jgi:hypothetical protein